MDGEMDGWINGWSDGWMDKWMEGWINGWRDGCTHRKSVSGPWGAMIKGLAWWMLFDTYKQTCRGVGHRDDSGVSYDIAPSL